MLPILAEKSPSVFESVTTIFSRPDTLAHPDGSLVNPNLHDYLIPTIADTPEIVTEAVESFEPRGPFGAKEIGEGSLLPVIGAIANAIYDACGVRMHELPITPERILAGLKRRDASGEKE